MARRRAPGTVQTEYKYEPFGGASASGEASSNSLQFTGRENDATTNLFYHRARYYSPIFQRFISEDPLGLVGGDVNLYSYVGNAPTAFVDRLGLEKQSCSGWTAWACRLASLLIGASIFATMVSIFIPTSALISFIAVVGAGLALVIAWRLGASPSELLTSVLQLGVTTAWAFAAPALVAAGAPSLLVLGVGLLVYAVTVTINHPTAPEPRT